MRGHFVALSTNNAVAAFPMTSTLQAIHNSAFATVAVDIYINGELAVDDLGFREATEFVEVPALANLEFAVTLADAADASEAFYEVEGAAPLGDLILVASGDPFADDDSDTPEFDLFGYEGAQMMAMDPAMVDLLVYHGSPDAPAVDVLVRDADLVLVDDLEYTDFTDDYASVDPALYVLQVTPGDDNDTVVAEFVADLGGLGGGAAVVLASGFLAPEGDDEPGFGLLVAFPDGSTMMLPMLMSIEMARMVPEDEVVAVEGIVTRALGRVSFLQEPAMDDDDDPDAIGTFSGSGSYRDAIEDGDIETGDELLIVGERSDFRSLQQISPDTFYVMSEGNMLPEPQVVTLAELAANGEAYESELITVEGIAINPEAYGEEPVTEFENNETYPISQGMTPEGEVDLRITGGSDTELGGVAIPAFADFTGVLGVFESDGVATYQLFPIEVSDIMALGTASVQVIHNSAHPSAGTVDISVNGAVMGAAGYLDDVMFRTATGYMMLPAGETSLAVLSSNGAVEVLEKTVTLEEGEEYVVIAAGSGATNADAADDFDLFVLPGMMMASGANTTDVQIFHGAHDAPVVDVRVEGTTTILADDIAFGDFVPYTPLPSQDYTLEVTTADGETVVAVYTAPLSGLGGETLNVLASGLLTPPDGEDGLGFALIAVDAEGDVIMLPVVSGVDTEGAGELPTDFAITGAFPNPTAGQATLAFDLPEAAEVSVALYDVMGRQVLTLPGSALSAGTNQQVDLDASSLAAGVYFFRATAEMGSGAVVRSGRLTLVR
jgi:hypothetical protein